MKVLITGGCGFIGYNLSRFLYDRGFKVIAMDNFVRRGSEWNRKFLEKNTNVKIVHGDCRHNEDFPQEKIDLIINTSAEPSATEGYKNPIFDITNNTGSVFLVLEKCRKENIPLIQFSTNKVYCGEKVNALPTKEYNTRFDFDYKKCGDDFEGINEEFGIDGGDHSIYGLSKVMGDLAIQEYSKAFKFNSICNRFSCLCGTNQWGKVIHGWVSWFPTAFLFNIPITYYGFKGKQIRDILYIDDINKLILTEIENIEKYYGEVFNVGGGKENTMSLIEAVNTMKRLTKTKVKVRYGEQRNADQKVYVSDIRKVSKEFNWRPRTTPTQALTKINTWVRNNKDIIKEVNQL